MSEQHIQGYGSSLEIYYTVIDKSDIQTKNDLCRLYIENLVEFGSNSETYFSTVEYQNDDFEEIPIKENLIRSSFDMVPKPSRDTIVLTTYAISKKGYLEFDIDDEIEVDVSYSC